MPFAYRATAPDDDDGFESYTQGVGRLRPGSTLQGLNAELRTITRGMIEKQRPDPDAFIEATGWQTSRICSAAARSRKRAARFRGGLYRVAARVRRNPAVQESGRANTGGVATRRWRSALVVMQLAVGVALLAGAGSLMKTFYE